MTDTNDNSVLLARIDERTRNIEHKIEELEHDLKTFKTKIDNDNFQLDKRLREYYVNRDTFVPVQRGMYLAVSTIVTAVLMAVLNFTLFKR